VSDTSYNHTSEIGSYSEKVAKGLVKQIVSAVAYLHELNIAHRDIKPTYEQISTNNKRNITFRFYSQYRNLLLASPGSNEIKLADFGLSKILGPDSMMQTACGTPIFVAPEVLSGEGYDKSVDCWGIGTEFGFIP
jgi:serine/threonine protein kinase